MQEEPSKISPDLESLSYKIIGLAIEVHRQLGPGLLESAYQQCLFYEIKKAGFKVEKEVMLPIIYKEIKIDHGYRIDLLIEDKLVVELKTVESFTSVHFAQILTYLKLGQYPLGLLINYNSKILKNNIKRFINTARDF
ncbi:GxxExxY protein [Flavobacterium succinicans]|uniref:GxxExxY protein n=1 Tax=Flavobacterium succinicans TaxID=29536 RepID=A0A1I4S238_9FLAO|nr:MULTISPECIES: GxxExxY protein [Flavobacterium]OOV29104.1 GxxExxY protein [Flavobacterium sp. LM5]SFM58568.1 GxxExxY protein [Flavobacterium succinicans]